MKIHFPNSAFLGNIDPFLRSFDPSHPEKLEITANKQWISIHPVVLAMVALNIRGNKQSTQFSLILTLLTILTQIAIIGIGLFTAPLARHETCSKDISIFSRWQFL